MSEPVSQWTPLAPLRVAIVAANPARRAQWVALVQSAGHVLVAEHDAQVILGEGEMARAAVPTVVLGPSHRDHAGQLPLEASAAQIDAALRAAANGLIVRHAAPDLREFEELTERVGVDLLTPRELDVLTAISDGLSNKAIARKLGISLHTVKFHVESLFRKLGARTRAEAVARGLERRRTEAVEI